MRRGGCCCGVLLLAPVGSAFQFQLQLPYPPPIQDKARHVPFSSAGIVGVGIGGPSARSSRILVHARVGIPVADRIHAIALGMSSQSHDDHYGADADTKDTQSDKTKAKKRRKPTKLSRIKTSRSIQSVYWTLCPAARYDHDNYDNNGNTKNARNRRKANKRNTGMNTDLSRTTHPLLAAATLRRVADLRALGMTYHLRRQRGQARPPAPKDRWKELGGELARTVFLPALIRCAGTSN